MRSNRFNQRDRAKQCQAEKVTKLREREEMDRLDRKEYYRVMRERKEY
jgi:hypothetical protein